MGRSVKARRTDRGEVAYTPKLGRGPSVTRSGVRRQRLWRRRRAEPLGQDRSEQDKDPDRLNLAEADENVHHIVDVVRATTEARRQPFE
jgi:hypothetical protein